jgi:hypothetical protein
MSEPTQSADYVAENQRLRGLIKVLCSDSSPFGGEAFQRTRDMVNPEHRALLLAVLIDGSGSADE